MDLSNVDDCFMPVENLSLLFAVSPTFSVFPKCLEEQNRSPYGGKGNNEQAELRSRETEATEACKTDVAST